MKASWIAYLYLLLLALGLKYTLYLIDKLMVEVWHLQFLQAAHRFIVVARG